MVEDRTDDRGEIAFEHVAAGTYAVVAESSAGRAQGAATVVEGGDAPLTLRLERR
jgi:hypothetical protein